MQRLLIDAKVSALNKTAQGDGSFTIDKVVLENNLLVEVGHFLQDSLLLNSKDSAVWKLALLWNLALQLNDIQTDIVKLGVSIVMDTSLASKQIKEVSLLQKSSEISSFVLSLSTIASEVEEVKTRELAAITNKVNDGTIPILNTITSITQSQHQVKETLEMDTVTKIDEKVEIIREIPVPHGVGDIIREATREFMDTKKADAEGIKLILFLSPVVIETTKSELIDSKFGAGTWSAILSFLLPSAPSPKSSLSPEAELFKQILSESISSTLEEVASVADDVWDSLKQLDDLQNQIVDDKLFSLISRINKDLALSANLMKIPGDVGGLIKAELEETFGEFLVGSGLGIKSMKTSLFDFALQLNEIKLQVVDTGVTGALDQTDKLDKLDGNVKDEAVKSIKESLVSKQAVVETLISSLFDLTVQLDDAKMNKDSHNVSAGLTPLVDKIAALINLVDGIVKGESLGLLTSTINTDILKDSGLVEVSDVEKIVHALNGKGVGEIEALEKEVEAVEAHTHTNQTFSELLKVHKPQDQNDSHFHP